MQKKKVNKELLTYIVAKCKYNPQTYIVKNESSLMRKILTNNC